ncbi:hypothetical protein I3A86_26695, partial [Salmonella enterica]|nr:hypothetical protein [Salmonella enterica]
TATGNLAAYALNTNGQTLTLGGNTLTIGDGTAGDAAGLILAAGSAISGGTLAFGGSEGVITTSGASAAISAAITGTDGLTLSGAGTVAINTAADVSGLVTVDSGTVALGALNVFASDAAGVLLNNTKSTPAAAGLSILANNTLSALNSAGNNSNVTIGAGADRHVAV